MAVSADPLRRETIGVVASLPSARLQAPVTNSALQLAEALARVSPEAQATMQGIAKTRADRAREQAKRDALQASGAGLADAVREGKLKPTQNPWYIQAYNREAAAIRAQDTLQKLQTDSSSWEEANDPQAFAARWRAEVGELAKGYEGPDMAAGFTAAEAAVSSQVLQVNVARNTQRIQAERTQNLGALAVDAIQGALRTRGGAITPNEAWEALLPARQQWFATGGDAEGWNKLVIQSVTSAAYGAKDRTLLDLLKAPELSVGPSEAGGVDRIGAGQGYLGATVTPLELPPSAPGQAAPQALRVEAPRAKLAPPVTGGRLTSGFGQRKAPIKGASTNHEGLDIALPQGTPVKAQATGRVVFAGKAGGYGNQVKVDYGNGVIASYSHLSAFSVKEGDLVAAGQPVAAVGRSGVATGPHLHYMLEVGGKKVDPQTFNGEVGGTFDGLAPADAPRPEALVGFPGQDQPFTASGYQAPANQYGRGPSLYGLPGVADQVESDRYRISEAAMAATTERMRQIDQQRTARGYEAQDRLLNKYGVGLLTGEVTRDAIIKDLNQAGYSAPEIAKTLNLLRDGLTDSVAVANAQVASRQQQPGNAKAVLDLQFKALTQGYDPGMEDRLGALVMSGDLTRDDAASMLSGAISRTKQKEAEARADEREARADERWEKSQRDVASYGDLKEQAQIASDYMVNLAVQSDPSNEIVYRDEKTKQMWRDRVQTAMGAWLQTHPKDFDGALLAGKQAAADYLRVVLRRGKKPAQAAPTQGNPRR